MLLATSTRPQPLASLGLLPASDGVYWPTSSTAPLISKALISTALGFRVPFLTSVSRRTAQQPATSGVAIDVPPRYMNLGSALTPQSRVSVASELRVESMQVPGATTSGLMRPSRVGPRDENAAMPRVSLATLSEPSGCLG